MRQFDSPIDKGENYVSMRIYQYQLIVSLKSYANHFQVIRRSQNSIKWLYSANFRFQ